MVMILMNTSQTCWLTSFLILCTSGAALAASFQGLHGFPGDSINSAAYAVSADGSVVVGTYWPDSGYPVQAFRWSRSGGMVRLSGNGLDGNEGAYGVSGDGLVAVGTTLQGYRDEATRWTDKNEIGLGGDPSSHDYFSDARAVSVDGSVIVGWGLSDSGREAYRWTAAGLVGLGDLPGDEFSSWADGVSADGSVVVGRGRSSVGDEAFRWTARGGMIGLGVLPGGTSSAATAVSADGLVVVGRATSAAGTSEAFRWTTSTGMVGLGHLPGIGFDTTAYGLSADGSVVVGSSYTTTGYEAFVWDAAKGMQNLQQFLEADCGLGLSGWRLTGAQAISPDGHFIVGYGMNPDNQMQAWIATVPEPSALILGFTLGAMSISKRWQGRRSSDTHVH